MSNNLPILMTHAQLYPPTEPASITVLVRTLLTGRREFEAGKSIAVLSRAPRSEERAAVKARLSELDKWAATGGRREKRDAITAMMMGFGGNVSVKDAAEIATQYVKICDDLPAWAVARACNRFSAGKVTAAELKVDKLDIGYRPSSAQVHFIAARECETVMVERQRLVDVLEGSFVPDKKVAAEVRERVLRGFEELRKGFGAAQKADEERRRSVDRDNAAKRWAANVEMIRREYRERGLEPPPGDTPTSLSMMLRQGWTIQENPFGPNVLVAPPMKKLVVKGSEKCG